MNRNILDQIGGDISSFRKNSFRLDQLNSSGQNFGQAFKDFKEQRLISDPKTRSNADNIDSDRQDSETL